MKTLNLFAKSGKETKSVLAFDLHDHSVREARIEIGSLEKRESRLLNYNGDTIILYDDSSLAYVTVESFKRIPLF